MFGPASSSTAHLTASTIALIKHMEGCRLDAYRDAVGVWTIGYGHTKGVYPGMTITQAQAERFLISDLKDAENDVSRCVRVPLSDNEYGALVSLVFNIGANAFKNSTCLKELNLGNRQAAADAMELFVKGHIHGRKRVLNGLVRRRRMERALFDRTEEIPGVNGQMQLAGELIPIPATQFQDGSHSLGSDLLSAVAVTPRRPLARNPRRARLVRRSFAAVGVGGLVTAAPVINMAPPDFYDHVTALWQQMMNSNALPSEAQVVQWFTALLDKAAAIPLFAHLQTLIGQIEAFAGAHPSDMWLVAAGSVVVGRIVIRRYVRHVIRTGLA